MYASPAMTFVLRPDLECFGSFVMWYDDIYLERYVEIDWQIDNEDGTAM